MIKIVLSVFSILVLSGCNTLTAVQTELGKGGFALWYPAEAGIQVGQIWRTNDQQRLWLERAPDTLVSYTSSSAFERLTKTVDADVTLDAKTSDNLLGNVGDLSVALNAGTVKSVDLDFGDTQIERLILSDLTDPNKISQFPKSYVSALSEVGKNNDFFVIAAVVKSAGMTYRLTCEDTAKLVAQAPAIAKAISAEAKVNVLSKTEAVLNIPRTTPLVIGILPVSGSVLNLPQPELEKKVAEKIDSATPLLNLDSVAKQQFPDLRI